MDGLDTTPIEITLGDGSVVKANDMEEAFRTVAKMKEDTAAALREAREQNERMADELQQFRARAPRHKYDASDGFDRDLYRQLQEEDPVMAQNYLDAVRFGISNPADVPAAFNQLHEQVGAIAQQSVAGAFLAQHYRDYSNSAENNRAMRVAMEQLCAQGFPFNLDTMNYAYNQLVSAGAIRKMDGDEGNRDAANPTLSGSSGAHEMDSELARFEQMSTPEMEAYLRAKGMLR